MKKNAARAIAGILLLGWRVASSAPDLESIPPPIKLTPADTVRFVVFGDAGTGFQTQFLVARAMGEVCAERGCDFGLDLGDNFYPSGVSDLLDPQFQEKFERPYANLHFPIYVVLGNHDTGISGSARNNKLGDVEVEYSRSGVSSKFQMPGRYYRFAVPARKGRKALAEFFALDSNPMTMIGRDADDRLNPMAYATDELNWLQAGLRSSGATWKVAFAHHPYISNGHGGNARKLLRSFLDQGICSQSVDLYLSGHNHDLEWLKPTPSCGQTQFITSGGGGAWLTRLDHDENPAYWERAGVYGFFWIQLDRQQMTAAAFTVDGDGVLPHDNSHHPRPDFEQSIPHVDAPALTKP